MYFKLLKLIIFILLLLPASCFADFIQVTLLGTGSPRLDLNRAGPAVLVEVAGKKLLFDSGRGVVQRLHQIDIPISSIQNVFLTHLHSDHISALDEVWLTGWIYQRKQPLIVYGPKGVLEFSHGLEEAYAYDIDVRHANAGLDKQNAHLKAIEIDQGVVYSADGVQVTALLVDHKPVEPAFGFRIDFGKRSIIISGDTTYSKNLIDHAKGVDLIIHEIFAAKKTLLAKNPRLQKIEHYHTNPEQLANILNKTKPRLAVLTHVILVGVSENEVLTKIKEGYTGQVLMGEDLLKIEIGTDVKVVRY